MKFLYLLLGLICCSTILAAEEPVSKSRISGLAIGGHSPTAYHDRQQATKGSKEFSYEWKQAQWLFADKQERDVFIADPVQYAPTYNGFCANALSLGEGLVKTNGKHWRIIDEQLYLFYSAKGRDRWRDNTVEYIKQANIAWQQELNKKN